MRLLVDNIALVLGQLQCLVSVRTCCDTSSTAEYVSLLLATRHTDTLGDLGRTFTLP